MTEPTERPIPYALTPKASAALSVGPVTDCGCGYADCSACAGYGWACLRCGTAYFGTPPDDGLCARRQPSGSGQ